MPRKIIIDTDPGVDDVLALLLALSALPEELEVLLISITFGNIDVQNCLRNVVSLFHTIKNEVTWREAQGHATGFETLFKTKPLVAVGAEHPLAEDMMMADFFHGRDGLGNIHETHPHMTPEDTWKALFQQAKNSASSAEQSIVEDLQGKDSLFTTSQRPSHEEILRLLGENEPDLITLVAIGPMTNLALAAATDPHTFLRAKEVVIMGGTIEEHGNITPCAEFNTFADAFAAARVYALSSPNPRSTMPPSPPTTTSPRDSNDPTPSFLSPYPENLPNQLKITLFPLDITHRHKLTRGEFRKHIEPLLAQKSPLAEWINAFMSSTFNKIETLEQNAAGDTVHLDLHDPLCIWYCMSQDPSQWTLIIDEDLRVETSGQWTRGMCVIDRRTRKKREDDFDDERPGDTGNWLGKRSGNRLRRCVGSPGADLFGTFLLQRIFALSQ